MPRLYCALVPLLAMIVVGTIGACGGEEEAGTTTGPAPPTAPSIPTGLAGWEAEHVIPDHTAQVLVVSNHLMVTLPGTTISSDVFRLADAVGATVVGSFAPSAGSIALYQFEIPEPSLVAVKESAAFLQGRSDVIQAAPRLLLPPNGHLDNDQLPSTEAWAYKKINLTKAWHLIERVNVDLGPVSVAVLDSGLDDSHPELTGVERVVGVNLLSGDREQWRDETGHGTAVTGVLSAVDNGIALNGVLGPEPTQYKLIIYRIAGRLPVESLAEQFDLPDWIRKLFCPERDEADPGDCEYSDSGAVQFALACVQQRTSEAAQLCPQANVVNYSYEGALNFTKMLRQAPEDFAFVAGAGNKGERISVDAGLDPHILLVGGTDRNDDRWDDLFESSAFGDISLAAPADEVLTTALGGGTSTRVC